MNCKIYKITNLVNGKIYIGQTRQSLIERFYKHCSKYSDSHFFMPIKQAIFKYGKENFKIEAIEYCDEESINDREIYWIEYYDSYNKGYNCTLGGQGTLKQYSLIEEDEINVCKMYSNKILSASKLAEKFNVDRTTIYNILKRRNVGLVYSKNLSKRIDINEFKLFLNGFPTILEICDKFQIGRCSVYNIIKRNNIEYNFSTSVRP